MSLSLEQCRKLQAAGCPMKEWGLAVDDKGQNEAMQSPTVEEMMTWLDGIQQKRKKYKREKAFVWLRVSNGIYEATSNVRGEENLCRSKPFPTALSALYDLWEKLEAGK